MVEKKELNCFQYLFLVEVSLFKHPFLIKSNKPTYHNYIITGETWRGKWQGNEIAAKILALRECTPRISRDFNEEYPKLR